MFYSRSTKVFFFPQTNKNNSRSVLSDGIGQIVILVEILFLGQMSRGPTEFENVAFFFFHIDFSFLALKCYIHFPKEATRRWTVYKYCLFLEWTPQFLKNGLGLEESLILKKSHLSTEKKCRKHYRYCKQYDFNIKLPLLSGLSSLQR